MYYKPILIVAGEPNSVFLEIFFKSIITNNYNNPLIIIVCKKLLAEQMQKLGFSYKINLINPNRINFQKINNKTINIIDIEYNFNNAFEKISKKSNDYIKKCFQVSTANATPSLSKGTALVRINSRCNFNPTSCKPHWHKS